MSLRTITDAWCDDLTGHVPGLADAVVHRYASWSREAFIADDQTHLAVWPDASPESVQRYATGMPPSDLVTHDFVVLVWRGATDETTRSFDDEDANGDWLDLFEAIRSRFYVTANVSLGQANSTTNYATAQVGMAATVRFIQVSFTNTHPLTGT